MCMALVAWQTGVEGLLTFNYAFSAVKIFFECLVASVESHIKLHCFISIPSLFVIECILMFGSPFG